MFDKISYLRVILAVKGSFFHTSLLLKAMHLLKPVERQVSMACLVALNCWRWVALVENQFIVLEKSASIKTSRTESLSSDISMKNIVFQSFSKSTCAQSLRVSISG